MRERVWGRAGPPQGPPQQLHLLTQTPCPALHVRLPLPAAA